MTREGESNGPARKGREVAVEERARVDVHPPEWLKKSRDDVPSNDLPLPESPLVVLNRRRSNSTGGNSSQRPSQNQG